MSAVKPANQHKNLLHWGVFAYTEHLGVYDSTRKEWFLEAMNQSIGRNYNVNHLNNWLAGRKKTPQLVTNYLIDSIIQIEIEEDIDADFGRELRRIISAK